MTSDTLSAPQLGRSAAIPASPEEAALDVVPNPQAGTLYLTRFTCPEFTSLCPVTGQPDFGHLVIDYAPDQLLVESKSLKLFLHSFRNHGAFHGYGQRVIRKSGLRFSVRSRANNKNSITLIISGRPT